MTRLALVVTDDSADLELLKLANEKGKFAIQLGYRLEPYMQFALERGMDSEWFTLVDISPVSVVPGSGYLRIFRLTEKGRARLASLDSETPTDDDPNGGRTVLDDKLDDPRHSQADHINRR